MELFDLDDVDLVVSYTIQILFIAKSANSPKILLYISIASTHTDRQWKGTGLELTKQNKKRVSAVQAWDTGNFLPPQSQQVLKSAPKAWKWIIVFCAELASVQRITNMMNCMYRFDTRNVKRTRDVSLEYSIWVPYKLYAKTLWKIYFTI